MKEHDPNVPIRTHHGQGHGRLKYDKKSLTIRSGPCRIAEDKRPIKGIYRVYEGWKTVEYWIDSAMDGHNVVSRIEAYEEFGETGPVPWFAVYVGDSIRWRIPAHMVTVEYAEAPE